MGDKYVFDANIFINLHQRQPRDVYPSVWNKIDELMASGTIISSREVYDELTRSDDSLSEWAKSRKEYFLPSEISIQEKVRKILSEHRGLVEGGKKQNNAAHWLQKKFALIVLMLPKSPIFVMPMGLHVSTLLGLPVR